MQAHEARVYPIENCHSLNVVITPLQQVDISISTRRSQSKKRKRQKKFCVNQTKLLMMLSFLSCSFVARCDALVLLSLFLVMEIDPNFA